jgi:hypothetical protein
MASYIGSVCLLSLFIISVVIMNRRQKRRVDVMREIYLHVDGIAGSINSGNGKHFVKVFKAKSVLK